MIASHRHIETTLAIADVAALVHRFSRANFTVHLGVHGVSEGPSETSIRWLGGVNQPTVGVIPGAPFGGWKASGLGPPEHGVGDPECYTRWQAVYGWSWQR